MLIDAEIAVALSADVPRYSKTAPVAAPTANKTVLVVALARAANHGLDLLSGSCSLGALGLREASIPFKRLSNAIICDLRRRMSSIRRSSLISITLGLLTVIGPSFRWLNLGPIKNVGTTPQPRTDCIFWTLCDNRGSKSRIEQRTIRGGLLGCRRRQRTA